MNYLVVLASLFAVAFAKPGYLHNNHHGLKTVSIQSEIPVVKTALIQEPATIAVQEKTLEKIGHKIERTPSAVSHQSQTIVHPGADKIVPILVEGVQTRHIPTLRAVEKQYIENVPVVQTAYLKSSQPQLSLVQPTYLKQSYGHNEWQSAPALNEWQSNQVLVKNIAPIADEWQSNYAQPAIIKSISSPVILKTVEQPTVIKSLNDPWAESAVYRSDVQKSW